MHYNIIQIFDMIIDNNSIDTAEQRQSSTNFKDLEMGERIRKVTTHDLFQLKRSGQSYMAKLFKPQFRHNYELQLNMLRLLSHPNIIQLRYCQSADTQLMGLLNYDMLILKHAQYGSLDQYIPLNGKLQQSVARVIFKQILSALKYAAGVEPNGVLYPDLQPSSVLLDSKRQVKICGWSKESPNKPKAQLIKSILFNSCQILMLMLTSYMPFFKKQSPIDPLYRYLKPNMINLFWQHFQKRVLTKYKQLQLSTSVKQLISNVFLKQWTTFEQIEASSWMQGPGLSYLQFSKLLAQLEKLSDEKRQDFMRRQKQRQRKNKQTVREYEEQTLRGSSSRSSGQQDFFIQDFYDNFYNKQDVPAYQCSELIRLFDDRPSFVIASLKQQLRNPQGNQINLLFGGQFQLEGYSVEKQANQVYLELKFQQNNTCEEDMEDVQIKVKVLIKFFKNTSNHLFAEVKILESNLSEYYAGIVLSFIENKIKQLKF